MKELSLTVVTPTGAISPVTCESVHCSVTDDSKGKGGGRYGIRSGHARALLTIAPGEVEALRQGERVFLCRCGSGFATVEDNMVTLVVESCVCE